MKNVRDPTAKLIARRRFMALAGGLAAAPLAALAEVTAAPQAEAPASAGRPSRRQRQPNVLFVFTDQGLLPRNTRRASPLPGHERLMRRGVSFTNTTVRR